MSKQSKAVQLADRCKQTGSVYSFASNIDLANAMAEELRRLDAENAGLKKTIVDMQDLTTELARESAGFKNECNALRAQLAQGDLTESPDLRWTISGEIHSRPTATDAIEYAEKRLVDKEEFDCCNSDYRLGSFSNVRRLLLNASEQAKPVANEREAFEAWGKKKGFVFVLVGNQYDDFATDKAWLSWQARAALKPAPAAVPDGWQSIETAPKDGTHVLLWWDGEVREGWCAGEKESRDGGDWWRAHSLVASKEGRPKLWHPMPAAPQPAQQTEQEKG